jgi:hypothetical protein
MNLTGPGDPSRLPLAGMRRGARDDISGPITQCPRIPSPADRLPPENSGHGKKIGGNSFPKAAEQPKWHILPDRQSAHVNFRENAAY